MANDDRLGKPVRWALRLVAILILAAGILLSMALQSGLPDFLHWI